MGYIKAVDVLPDELILEIQKYIDCEMLYIPRKCEEHSYWGEKSGIRQRLEKRDKKIFDEHISGKTVADLAREYYLSEKIKESSTKKDTIRSIPAMKFLHANFVTVRWYPVVPEVIIGSIALIALRVSM